ncbi:lysine exporter protein LysE/YggA [Paraglaciecola mesophila KMM 241]|uniref:Lysine exporter protein LysE/YggA n=1 Tax=Paraglaciecola mesophila KMM 241 TaxID=1128912 RepID=K6XYZ4_9ALTE|nr:LysE family transporter [Paraglaciecola mesophila]GAC25789.1 lysine exporter protein LysE/YggA [Paraglaciecola mesophila KMM 241]|tara:strand:- start:254 stop:889 length:636 start_codon:yes stop_codon:yes gene_type:complete
MELSLYWGEFLTIAGVHLLAVASPGPDFAIVLKHSITYGRRIAMITSVGVGAAILLHVTYSLLGIGLLLKTNPLVYTIFSYLAAAYLVYIAIGALKSKAPDTTAPVSTNGIQISISDKKAFAVGFLTNGLNPKATLFFLSVFAVAVSAETPSSIKLVYGLYLAVATGVWFCFLSYLLSTRKVRAFIRQYSHWFDRVMGGVLLLLAAKLVMT